MKKIIALVLALVCVLSLAGCRTLKPTDQIEELAGAPLAPVGTDTDYETVSHLEIMSGQTGQKITVKDSDNVQKVMDDIESLNYKKMDATEEIEFAYRIRFYNENYDELGRIFITEENGHQISYDGYYYLIEDNLNVNVDYLEDLLKDAPPAEPGDEGNDELPDRDSKTEYEEEMIVRDNFSITSSALSAGNYECSENTYTIESEKDYLMYSMNWSPTGQSVQIGFMSNENNTMYLIDPAEGGSVAGTINTVNVPNGEYCVIVFAVSDNTEPFSINATCEWKTLKT